MKKRIFVGFLAGFMTYSCWADNIYDPLVMDNKEKKLTAIANQPDSYNFTPLRAGNTTKDAWILSNKTTQEKLAVLKCTSGNNYAPSDIAAYHLGRKLDFPIYPVAVGMQIDNRLAKILHVKPQFCALKEYLTNWSVYYWKAQANLQKIKASGQLKTYRLKNTFLTPPADRRALVETLMCKNYLKDINHTFIKLTSGIKTSRNGNPILNGKYTAFTSTPISLLEASKAFSNLMVLDAVLGNGDRFPGANLEFRSGQNASNTIDKQTVEIIDPHLSSMDIGMAFKGWSNSWAKIELGYYLRRFDPQMIQNLKTLLSQLDQLTPTDLAGEWRFLNFNTQFNSKMSATTYLKNNIKWVLNFIDNAQKKTYKGQLPDEKYSCIEPFLKI